MNSLFCELIAFSANYWHARWIKGIFCELLNFDSLIFYRIIQKNTRRIQHTFENILLGILESQKSNMLWNMRSLFLWFRSQKSKCGDVGKHVFEFRSYCFSISNTWRCWWRAIFKSGNCFKNFACLEIQHTRNYFWNVDILKIQTFELSD